MSDHAEIGDMVLAEVVSTGRHVAIEDRNGVSVHIFPGDRVMVCFGNRYATDQYEGYIPAQIGAQCDLLSVGGVCGEVVSQHSSMGTPTKLRILGRACDADGNPINTRQVDVASEIVPFGQSEVLLVVGASMNSGKTTTVGTLVRSLKLAGHSVAAIKVTGTAAGKDGRFFASCGAMAVYDFTDVGYPSTYMVAEDELLSIYTALLMRAQQHRPDFVVVEIADGIFQRETRMLLESAVVRASIDHLFFTANDSLSAECGSRLLHMADLPLRAIAGVFTQSPLSVREAVEITRMPCLSIADMLDGKALALIEASREEALVVGWDRAA
jgi:hypothetical protein